MCSHLCRDLMERAIAVQKSAVHGQVPACALARLARCPGAALAARCTAFSAARVTRADPVLVRWNDYFFCSEVVDPSRASRRSSRPARRSARPVRLVRSRSVVVTIAIRPERNVVDVRSHNPLGLEQVTPCVDRKREQDGREGRPRQYDPHHLLFPLDVGGQIASIIGVGPQTKKPSGCFTAAPQRD
jgi:hypothetical protein